MSKCRNQMYFQSVESVWAPKQWAQIFKNFTNFFLTLISLITAHSSYLIIFLTLLSCLASKSS